MLSFRYIKANELVRIVNGIYGRPHNRVRPRTDARQLFSSQQDSDPNLQGTMLRSSLVGGR
jgi:hypothetical protein